MLRSLMISVNFVQRIGKMKDSITIGLLGGLIGTVFMDISNILIFKAGKTEALYGHIAGGLLVAPFRTNQKKNFLLGEITHMGIGSIWGTVLMYFLKKTGKDHHLIKGVFVSLLTLGSLIIAQSLDMLKKFKLTKTFYSAFWNHLVFGLTSAQAIVMLADPTIFESVKQVDKDVNHEVSHYPYQVRNNNILDHSQQIQ